MKKKWTGEAWVPQHVFLLLQNCPCVSGLLRGKEALNHHFERILKTSTVLCQHPAQKWNSPILSTTQVIEEIKWCSRFVLLEGKTNSFIVKVEILLTPRSQRCHHEMNVFEYQKRVNVLFSFVCTSRWEIPKISPSVILDQGKELGRDDKMTTKASHLILILWNLRL